MRMKPDAILFVYSSAKKMSYVIMIIGMIISTLYCMYYKSERFYLRKNWKGLFIMILTFAVLVAIPMFFIRDGYDISETGIIDIPI